GVTSLRLTTSKPAAPRERTAVSRPGPGPLMKTATCLTPISTAFLATLLAVTPAAKGVPFLVPRKPEPPAVAQARTSPRSSVSVTMVLLKEHWTWTFAKVTDFQVFLRGAGAGTPFGAAAAIFSSA